jgi:hypothetical protein
MPPSLAGRVEGTSASPLYRARQFLQAEEIPPAAELPPTSAISCSVIILFSVSGPREMNTRILYYRIISFPTTCRRRVGRSAPFEDSAFCPAPLDYC